MRTCGMLALLAGLAALTANSVPVRAADKTEPATAFKPVVVLRVKALGELINDLRYLVKMAGREEEAKQGLRSRVVAAVGEAQAALGFAPRLSMEGLLDTDVPVRLADEVVAVLGEALSNAARHAKARRVEVVLQATGQQVVLTV